ncbi:MAG: thioredoxin [Bacteroidaceae bacterium]|nr:thioredoxin [Bacteroidaceae bacterium]
MKINNSNYESVLAEGKPLVLDFWATWCGPCRMIAPIIEALAEEYAGQVNIGKVDVEDEEAEDLVSKFSIRNVPTVLFIKDGQVVDKIVGAAPRNMYEDKIKAML